MRYFNSLAPAKNRPAGLIILWAGLILGGCETPPPDANPQVFQTISQTAELRHSQQLREWKQAAITVTKEERPDVSVSEGTGFAITVEADGASQVIDLSPLLPVLSAQSGRTDEIVRRHLAQQLPRFDQQRLAHRSLESVRGRLRPMLVSADQLSQLAAMLGGTTRPHAPLVAAGLNWVAAVRWQEAGPLTPVGPEALAAWGVSAEQVGQMALANLHSGMHDKVFETVSFSTGGRVGNLKAGTEPAFILLPEFLAAVRQAWKSEEDLVVLLASPGDVRFLESSNTRLLDMLYPQWQRALETTAQPLCRRPLLLSNQGVSEFAYNPPVQIRQLAATRPTTQPATRPGMPKITPKPYIAR